MGLERGAGGVAAAGVLVAERACRPPPAGTSWPARSAGTTAPVTGSGGPAPCTARVPNPLPSRSTIRPAAGRRGAPSTSERVMTPTGWPPSSTSAAEAASRRSMATSTGSPMPTVGSGGPITSPTGLSRAPGSATDDLEQLALGHRADHLGQHHRRLVLHHRHLAHLELAQDLDGRAARSRRDGCARATAGRPRGPAAGRRRSGRRRAGSRGRPSSRRRRASTGSRGRSRGCARRRRRPAGARAPTCRAAAIAVPPDPPMSRPSSRVTRRAVAKLVGVADRR